MKKYLVLSPIELNDVYQKKWVEGQKDFDFMLVNYSGLPRERFSWCDYYYEVKGFKYEIIKKAVEANIDLIKKYDFIWCPDGDLDISTKEINTLFRICREHKLNLAQPSVSNSLVMHFIVRRRPYCILRYVNFVELMCPVFSRETLFKVLDTFNLNRSGHGIDWLWAKRIGSKRMAIIDAVSVYHTRRPCSGSNYKQINSSSVSVREECLRLLSDYGLEEGYYKHYGSILRPWAKVLKLSLLPWFVENRLLKLQAKVCELRRGRRA